MAPLSESPRPCEAVPPALCHRATRSPGFQPQIRGLHALPRLSTHNEHPERPGVSTPGATVAPGLQDQTPGAGPVGPLSAWAAGTHSLGRGGGSAPQ